jgi:hypothetical protein
MEKESPLLSGQASQTTRTKVTIAVFRQSRRVDRSVRRFIRKIEKKKKERMPPPHHHHPPEECQKKQNKCNALFAQRPNNVKQDTR